MKLISRVFDNWCFATFEIHEKHFKYAATRVERVSCREFSDLEKIRLLEFLWWFGCFFRAHSRVPAACNLVPLALS